MCPNKDGRLITHSIAVHVLSDGIEAETRWCPNCGCNVTISSEKYDLKPNDFGSWLNNPAKRFVGGCY